VYVPVNGPLVVVRTSPAPRMQVTTPSLSAGAWYPQVWLVTGAVALLQAAATIAALARTGDFHNLILGTVGGTWWRGKAIE